MESKLSLHIYADTVFWRAIFPSSFLWQDVEKICQIITGRGCRLSSGVTAASFAVEVERNGWRLAAAFDQSVN